MKKMQEKRGPQNSRELGYPEMWSLGELENEESDLT